MQGNINFVVEKYYTKQKLHEDFLLQQHWINTEIAIAKKNLLAY